MTPEDIARSKKAIALGIVSIRATLKAGNVERSQEGLRQVNGLMNLLRQEGVTLEPILEASFNEVAMGIVALAEQQCVANIRADVAASQQHVSDASVKAEMAADAEEQIAAAKAEVARMQAVDDDGGGGAAAPGPQVVAPEPQAIVPGPQVVAPEPQAIVPGLQVVAIEPQAAAPEPQGGYGACRQNATDGYVVLAGGDEDVKGGPCDNCAIS
jgi:hypothetical protein